MPSFLTPFDRSRRETTRRSPRRRRRASFRATCETLESRLVMSVDFKLLAGQINSALASTQSAVDAVLSNSTVDLPVVGKSAHDLMGTFDSALTSARNTLQSTIGNLSPQAQQGAIEQAIGSALDQIGVLHDHVTVTSYDPAAGDITIDMGLKKLVAVSQNLNFNLGLPSLPFKVTSTGDINVTVGMEYDNLRFGINNTGFFLDTSPLNELKVSFDAGLSPSANIQADAGLFQVSAKPLNPSTFGLHAGISYDVGGAVAPSLTGSANADLALSGSFGGTNSTGEFKFPNVQANLLMNWDLGTKASADPTAPLAHFGDSAPTVSFQNVQVGFGSYLSNLLSPLTARFSEPT